MEKIHASPLRCAIKKWDASSTLWFGITKSGKEVFELFGKWIEISTPRKVIPWDYVQNAQEMEGFDVEDFSAKYELFKFSFVRHPYERWGKSCGYVILDVN